MQMQVAHESPGTERGQPDDGRLIATQLVSRRGEIDQLVLGPKTYSLMGQQLILAPSAGAAAGRVQRGTAILSTVLVSGPESCPGHTHESGRA